MTERHESSLDMEQEISELKTQIHEYWDEVREKKLSH